MIVCKIIKIVDNIQHIEDSKPNNTHPRVKAIAVNIGVKGHDNGKTKGMGEYLTYPPVA